MYLKKDIVIYNAVSFFFIYLSLSYFRSMVNVLLRTAVYERHLFNACPSCQYSINSSVVSFCIGVVL